MNCIVPPLFFILISTFSLCVLAESNENVNPAPIPHHHHHHPCLLQGNLSDSVGVGNNPYGMIVVPSAAITDPGQFRYGDLVVSSWNDNRNNSIFGQGNLLDVIFNGTVVRNLTIPKDRIGECGFDNVDGTGLGFTMALAWLGNGMLLQCSTPINRGNAATNTDGNVFPAHPGCCLVINSNGDVLASFRGNGINGPWAATSVLHGGSTDIVTVFISNVLGPTGNPNAVNQGKVERYTFVLPGQHLGWRNGIGTTNPGTLGRAYTLANGFVSTPVSITSGTVGPSGLAYSTLRDRLYIAGTLEGTNGKIFYVENPLRCSPCTLKTFAVCAPGNCNGPIGINMALVSPNVEDLLVANGGDGNLVQYKQNGTVVCSITGDANGAGTLFNVLTVPYGPSQQVAFVDDALNQVLFLHPFNLSFGH